MTITNPQNYYKQVGDYYDHDAGNFESRYWQNPILQEIRKSFRDITDGYSFQNVLEIGYGPGLDLLYFAEKNPRADVYGVDISKGMYDATVINIAKEKLSNVHVAVGSVEDVKHVFPDQKFDMIYVFFGALNTVADLNLAAKELENLLAKDGKMVLTFVNKWYMKGIIAPLLKGRLKIAFARLRKVWGGYSTSHFLPSKCYSISEVKRAFHSFDIKKIRGYSITYPAWYDGYKFKNKKLLNSLWKTDAVLGTNLFKGWGEYSLFVFQKRG